MTALLEELLASAANDPAGCYEEVVRRGGEVTAELGDEANALFADASRRGDHNQAQLAAIVASAVFLAVDDIPRSLSANIEVVRLSLLDAPSAEACSRVRFEAAKCVTMAERLGDERDAFAAAVVVGEAAYAAWEAMAETEGVVPADRAWRLCAIDDLLAASRLRRGGALGAALAPLVVLASMTVGRATEGTPSDRPPEVTEHLVALRDELGRVMREGTERVEGATIDQLAAVVEWLRSKIG